ncbi:MAG: efflux RND transporter periplasmic adaptor subunit [Kiritimatiellae bacterium]|nr:efflux RND transporter periplasmic adaptor subunit [Kiritimatiellia bacterium]
MIRKRTIAAAWALSAVVILALAASGCKRAAHAPPMAPPEVMVMNVVQKDVAIYGDWIGTLDGMVNAQIHAQVSGYLMAQCYTEGDLVHKGDLLFQIDPRPFQAALDKARGQLAEAQANLDLTAINVKRYTPLAKNNAISQQELDNAIQSNKGAQAALESAQAAVQQADLNLEFTKVTSPIDGIAGIAEAQVGDLVGPSSSELTAVSTVDPIKVYFPISEQEYMLAMENRMAQGRGDMASGHTTNNLELILANGETYPDLGAIVTADRQVNVKTGTIRIAALFPNPHFILRPGQYAHVRLPIKTLAGALLVPQRAIIETQGSYHVVVVDKNNQASIRTVQTGDRSGSLWVIAKGLNPGDRVVVEGMQKAREGTLVNPKPFIAEAGPAPAAGTNASTPSGAIKP